MRVGGLALTTGDGIPRDPISGYAVRVYENTAVTRTVAFAGNHTHRTVTGLTQNRLGFIRGPDF